MESMKTIRYLGIALACVVVVASVASCDKASNTEVQSTSAKDQKEPTLQERYDAKFKRLVVRQRRESDERSSSMDIGDVCQELAGLPKEESLPLLDKLIDMAIAQPITDSDYHLRQVWFEQLFHVVHGAFNVSQRMRKESFDHWDKLFLLFKKYTDEITEIEKSLRPTNKYGTKRGLERSDYLLGLKGDLKQWVHVMRHFYFPMLSEGLTENQKADIMRRFREVEDFASRTPDSPGYKK